MKVFVAGAMQGPNLGYTLVDQSYRADLQRVLTEQFPGCEIICPLTFLGGIFRAKLPQLVEMHRSAPNTPIFSPKEVGPPLGEVIDAFHELVRLAASADLLIAYLPANTLSMGTSIEMWAAFTNGVPVVAITNLTQNLAVLSCSTFIVSSIEKLEQLLQTRQPEQWSRTARPDG